jgi:DNA invertase Pin-like site-specific DNA recombinase
MHQAIHTKEKALSYYRFSDPKQSRGDSKRRQEDEASWYAAQNNLEIVETFRDEGVSSFRGDNATKGSFGEIIYLANSGLIQAEGINHIIVEGFDRMSRMEVDDAYEQFRALLKAGITVHTTQDRRVYNKASLKDPMYLMGSIMIMARAHEESQTKSYRGKKARERGRVAAREGTKQMTKKCPAWLSWNDKFEWKGKRGWFEPIDKRAEVVRDIYKLAAEGHSIYYIARKLTDENVPTWGNAENGWSTTYVSAILKTEKVLGTMQPCKRNDQNKYVPDGPPIPDYYPAVVSVDLYNRAQEAKRPVNNKRAGGGATGETYTNLFKGLLHCACCSNGERQVTMHVRGSGMSRDGSKEYKYLICAAKRKKGSHQSKRNFQYDEFEKLFLDYVTGLDTTRLTPSRSADSKADTLKAQIADSEYRIKNIHTALENLGIQLDTATTQRTGQFIQERIDKKLAELNEAEQNLKVLNGQIKKLQVKEERRSRNHDRFEG